MSRGGGRTSRQNQVFHRTMSGLFLKPGMEQFGQAPGAASPGMMASGGSMLIHHLTLLM